MKSYQNIFITFLLMLFFPVIACADVEVADLKGEDKENFDRFRDLFQNGTPDEFYSFAESYEANLKSKGYMMLYYKLKNNEGFFALRHNKVLRAMQAADELDRELRQNNATEYYYLATGLKGDIYAMTQNRAKAEECFLRALKEAGDADSKFTMRTYQNLTELFCVKNPRRALEYAKESLLLARKTANVEYQSLALAMIAYVYFLDGNKEGFADYYGQYVTLRNTSKTLFNHRYDLLMDVARLALDNDFSQAEDKLHNGRVYVDSSLVAMRIATLETGDERGFVAIKDRILEIDSIHALMRSANFDQLAVEQRQLLSADTTEYVSSFWIVLSLCLALTTLGLAVLCWRQRRGVPSAMPSVVVRQSASDRQEQTIRVNDFCRSVLSAVKKEEGRQVELRFSTRVPDELTVLLQPAVLCDILTLQLQKAIQQADNKYVLLHCEQQDNRLMLSVSSSDPSCVYTISCAC